MEKNPKVFISYAHDNEEFANKILSFSNKLRSKGIDANIDQYEDSPPEGWHRWMENQIAQSDFVLIICTELYFQKCYGLEGKYGRGISWEVSITYQHLYDSYSNNTKFIPVIFESNDWDNVLTPLKSATIYNVSETKGFDDLYWRLRGVKKVEKTPLGELTPLPEKERVQIFYSSLINIELWDKAKWGGMMYMFPQSHFSLYHPPTICFIFDNYETGVKIFNEWKKQESRIKNDLDITIVESPFPQNRITLPNGEAYKTDNNKGYFVCLSSNYRRTSDRLTKDKSFVADEMSFATTSRYHWMPELSGTKNRDTFKILYQRHSKCYIAPIYIKDKSNPKSDTIFDFNNAIEFSNIKFISGDKLDATSSAWCVLFGDDKTHSAVIPATSYQN